MNNVRTALSPLFRSDTQAELLARLLLNPGQAFTISELSRAIGAPYATTHHEVTRLMNTGLLHSEQVGRAIRLSADDSNPAYRHLVGLLLLSYGPAVVIERELEGIAGIREAYIYGSWAARRAGEPGTSPQDIDVLVVGNPARASIHEAAAAAERQLGREVNVRTVSPDVWEADSDLFIRTVKEKPLHRLELETTE